METNLELAITINNPTKPDATPDESKEIPLKQKQEKKGKKFTQYMFNLIMPISKLLSLYDFATDLVLMYRISQNPNLVFSMIYLSITTVLPYLISYSCGVQLYLNQGTFDKFTTKSCCLKFLILLFLSPFGVLYYIFLDIYFIIFNLLLLWPLTVFLCFDSTQLDQKRIAITQFVGMSLMDYQGYSTLRSVSRLMFSTIPELIFQTLLYFTIIDSLGSVKPSLLIQSIAAGSGNLLIQFLKIKIESIGFEESFLNYALKCMIGKYGWIPFSHKIQKYGYNENILNDNDKQFKTLIDYDENNIKICTFK
eukprot:155363_1